MFSFAAASIIQFLNKFETLQVSIMLLLKVLNYSKLCGLQVKITNQKPSIAPVDPMISF